MSEEFFVFVVCVSQPFAVHYVLLLVRCEYLKSIHDFLHFYLLVDSTKWGTTAEGHRRVLDLQDLFDHSKFAHNRLMLGANIAMCSSISETQTW